MEIPQIQIDIDVDDNDNSNNNQPIHVIQNSLRDHPKAKSAGDFLSESQLLTDSSPQTSANLTSTSFLSINSASSQPGEGRRQSGFLQTSLESFKRRAKLLSSKLIIVSTFIIIIKCLADGKA